MSDLDEAAAAVAQTRDLPLRASLVEAVRMDPEAEAEARRVAKSTGVPVQTVIAFPKEMKQRAALEGVDTRALMERSPGVAKYLSDVDNAAIAHDDIGTLTDMERAIRAVTNAPRALARFPFTMSGGLTGVAAAGAEVFGRAADVLANAGARVFGGPADYRAPVNPWRATGEWLRRYQRQIDADAAAVFTPPKDAGIIEAGLYSAVESTAQSLSMLPFGPAAVITGMGMIEGGRSYGKARDKDLDPARAALFGIGQGLAEAAGESIPVLKLFKDIKAGSTIGRLLFNNIIREVPGELATTITQSFNEWLTLNPDKTLQDWTAELPAELATTVVATVLGSGMQSAAISGAMKVAEKAGQRKARMEQEAASEELRRIVELANIAKVAGRDPSSFEQAVEMMAEGSRLEAVYIDGKAFHQALMDAGVDPGMVALSVPAVAEQMAAAVDEGRDIRIPVEQFAARLARQPFAEALLPHLKPSEDAMSPAEAKEALKEEGDRLRTEMESALADTRDEFKASADRVRQRIEDELNAAPRFNKDVNAANARVHAAFFAAQARRLGMTPEEVFDKFGPKYVAEGVGALDQAADVDLAPGGGSKPFKLGDTTIDYGVSSDGKRMEVILVKTPKDKRGQGSARRAMQALLAAADRRGMQVVLTAEPMDKGVSKAKLEAFYKTLGFKPNKGRAKDFTTKAGMLREPRAAAINAPQTETAAFKKWFGDSKVVDANGEPLVVYHGTNADFDVFDLDALGKTDDGWLGDGFYFTSRPKYAAGFAKGDGANLMPVFLALRNPYYAEGLLPDYLSREKLMAAGFDGVVYEGGKDGKGDSPEYVAFRPEQIKSAIGNRGTFDPNDPNILRQTAQRIFDQTQTDAFKRWSNNAPLVTSGEAEAHEFKAGEPVVVAALHGTTGDFTEFNRSMANIESDLGGGFYFTNNPSDVGENYAGMGPDLTNKIQGEAERLESAEDLDPDEAQRIARDKWMANDGLTMPVWVKFNNPVVLGGQSETFLSYEEAYDEETDEFGEPQGDLIKIIESLRQVASDERYGDFDVEQVIADVMERAMDGGISAREFISVAGLSEGLVYAADYETDGKLASKEILRRTFEEAGFDGFIDTTVDEKFGTQSEGQRKFGKGMKGMDEETVHFIAFKPTQIKSRLGNRGTFDPNDPNILHQPAFHGTPHRGIEKFSTDKIGTGEGAQAYGYGLYFASRREVAEWYRKNLSGGDLASPYSKDGRVIDTMAELAEAYYQPGRIVRGFGGADKVLRFERNDNGVWSVQVVGVRANGDAMPSERPRWHSTFPDAPSLKAVLEGDGWRRQEAGQLYEVQVPEDDTLLLWDKPLSEQPEKVREALMARLADKTAQLVEAQREFLPDVTPESTMDGAEAYRHLSGELGSDKAASEVLAAAGIKGIKYLDGTSRGAGDGTFNYVIFSGDDVQITRQFYQGRPQPAPPRAFFDPESNTIGLLKNADLSSFHHESGHYYLESLGAMARAIVAKRAAGEQVTPGEQSILDDMDAALKWMGVKGDENLTALDTWSMMDLEQQRNAHEKFARGFEGYLFEGNAPSLELAALFQRFRAWMVRIYKELRGLNIELSDDIRGVYDRLLASDEEIADARAVREMGAMFNAQDGSGMTPAEWANYQALAAQAVGDARAELDGRLLRDMKWLRNAHQKALKQRKREVAAIRAEIERDVRAEVMVQPVYRAWAFLTGKGDPEQMAKRAREARKTEVDPTRDSLFTAIAKLGGLSLDSVTAQWGRQWGEVNLARPVFGKPVVRKSGGLTVGKMSEHLLELGYLLPDEDGSVDLSEFEAKADREFGGEPQYAIAKEYTAPADEDVDLEQFISGRLNTAAVKRVYETQPDKAKRLQDLGMTSPEGLEPVAVSQPMGFDSPSAMLEALIEARPPEELIGEMTDQRLLEMHGDITSDAALKAAADAAVHNEAAARILAAEIKALDDASRARAPTGRKTRAGRPVTFDVLAAAAKDYAAATIAGLRLRDLTTGVYAQAAAKAARLAKKAFAKGDIEGTARQKRNQLINHEAAREAAAALREVDKGVRYLRRFATRSKTIDITYADQIDQLLEQYDLKAMPKSEARRREGLAEWIATQQAAGNTVDIDPALAEAAARKPWRNMTVEEFRGLVDAVKEIEHLGRLKHKLATAKAERDFRAVKGAILDRIADNNRPPADNVTRNTRMATVSRRVKDFLAQHRKIASLVREIDGFLSGGPLWEALARPMNEAGDKEADMRSEATTRLWGIFKPLLKGGRLNGSEDKSFIKSLGRSFTREERIAIVLNMGNDGNLQRLMDGGVGLRNADGRAQPVSRAQLQSVVESLTREEMDAVQAIWDFFESYRPAIWELERRTRGVEPRMVTPTPLDTRHGTYRGGYYPVRYDPRQSSRAADNATAEDAKRMQQGSVTQATTRRSFVKQRSEKVVGRPLLLTMDAMWGGVNDVIHDITWREWVIDAKKLLDDKDISGAINDRYGAEVLAQFKEAVKDIAAGDLPPKGALEGAMAHARTGSVIAVMGFNLVNALVNVSGFTQAAVRIGYANMAKGIAKTARNPYKALTQAHEKSTMMRLRAQTMQREVAEVRNAALGQTALRRGFNRAMFIPLEVTQAMVDIPTWWGAYEAALAEGNDEERAVALADQAVIDSQSAGQIKDLAAIQRGSQLNKLFTTLYGYMSAAYNLGVEQTKATNFRKPAEVMKLMADYVALYSVPVVLTVLLREAIIGGEDDEDKLLAKLVAGHISYIFGLLVGVREVSASAAYVAEKFAGNEDARHFGYGGPVGLMALRELDRAAEQIAQGEADRAALRSLINLLGVGFKLPSGQINRSIDGVIAIEEGRTENPAAVLLGPPRE